MEDIATCTTKGKIDPKKINLEITGFKGFNNDTYTGFDIEWNSDIGFGEYSFYRKKADEEFKILAVSEHMDYDDEKEFGKMLLHLLLEQTKIME